MYPIFSKTQPPLLQAVVFFSYWQSVALAIMAKLGLIRGSEWSTYDADDVAAGLQNFLICVEMFLAAVMHAHAFPPRVGGWWFPPWWCWKGHGTGVGDVYARLSALRAQQGEEWGWARPGLGKCGSRGC